MAFKKIGSVAAIICTISLPMIALIYSVAVVRQLVELRELNRWGIESAGIVIQKDSVAERAKTGSMDIFSLTFSYIDTIGREYTRSQKVDRTIYMTHTVGDSIGIIYSVTNSQKVTIVGNRVIILRCIQAGMIDLFLCIGFFVFYKRYKKEKSARSI